MKRQSKQTKRANSPKRTKNPSKKQKNKRIGGGMNDIDDYEISNNLVNPWKYQNFVPQPSLDTRFIRMYLITREQTRAILQEANYSNKKIFIIRNKKIDSNVFANQANFLNTEGVITYPVFNNGIVSYSDDLFSADSIQAKLTSLRNNGYINIDALN